MAAHRLAAIPRRIGVAVMLVALLSAPRHATAQRVRWRSASRPSAAPPGRHERRRIRFGIATVGSTVIPVYDWRAAGAITYATLGGLGLAVEAGPTVAWSRNSSVAVLGQFSLTTMLWFNDARTAFLAEYVYADIVGVAGGMAGGIQFAPDGYGGVFGRLNAALPLRVAGYIGYGGASGHHAFSAWIEVAPGFVWDWVSARGFVAAEIMAGIAYAYR